MAEWIDMAAPIFACIGVAIALVNLFQLRKTYLATHERTCKQTTIEFFNELKKESEEIEKKLFEEYVQTELASYGDLLSVEETMEITGYSSTAIYRWCNAKKLVGFKISGKFIIPKIGLAEFLISPYSCGIQRKSWRHLLFVATFLKELNKLDKQLP